jgi:FAD/FMN-containing dehydrogenase
MPHTPNVFGFDPDGGIWLTTPGASSVPVPDLDGRLSLDLPSRQAAATDWGQAVRSLPLAVLYPGSVADIMKMVRFCRLFGIKLGVRGQAHTMYGQSQVPSGVAIEMRSLNRIHFIESNRASVDAGLTWKDLLTATVARGLTPPVLTDYLPLSVGGTLSVGGVNGTSYKHGAQVDNTLDLDVVTGDGDLITCSMSQHRDLFEAALAGLGQCAIIVRASIKLGPAPANARVFDMAYPDLGSLLADFRTLLSDERFSYLEGIVPASPTGGFTYVLEGVSFYDAESLDNSVLLSGLNFIPGSVNPVDSTYFDFCDRVAQIEGALKAIGRWDLPHPWLDMFIPQSQAERYISGALAGLTFNDVPDFPNFIYGFRKSRLTRPLLRTPDEEVFFLFDILRTTDPAQISAAVAQNRQFYEEGRSSGGLLYPISAVRLSEHDWQRHFEPEYKQLVNAKTRYDSDGILTPGPGIFG